MSADKFPTLFAQYPPGWPACPGCGHPAHDGHITCGAATCNESHWRSIKDRERLAYVPTAADLKDILADLGSALADDDTLEVEPESCATPDPVTSEAQRAMTAWLVQSEARLLELEEQDRLLTERLEQLSAERGDLVRRCDLLRKLLPRA